MEEDRNACTKILGIMIRRLLCLTFLPVVAMANRKNFLLGSTINSSSSSVPYPVPDVIASNGWSDSRHTLLTKWQVSSDVLIALAYFSIPLEIIYFIFKSQVFPYRWVVAQFGLFIVLCGTTHLLTVWHYSANTAAAHIVMTVFKVLTALVSCSTAVLLVWVIPETLDVKKREQFYTQKTAELGIEVGKIKKDEQTLRSVRMLTDEIRSTLDRKTILETTIMELARTLNLESCDIWMPKHGEPDLELTHRFGAGFNFSKIPVTHGIIRRVLSSHTAKVIPDLNDIITETSLDSPGSAANFSPGSVASSGSLASPGGVVSPGRSTSLDGKNLADATTLNRDTILRKSQTGRIAAVRLPILTFEDNNTDAESFGIMLLALPKDSAKPFSAHDLELINNVADQVAVALSHAAVVEEATRSRDKLMEQNVALQIAKQEAEAAVIARNEFLAVMNHEMRTPMHAILALSSLLLDCPLGEDERLMVETITKSGNLLAMLINDVLDFSKLEAGSLSLDIHPFVLPELLKEAERLVIPMADSKTLSVSMNCQSGLPINVIGDSNRLLQIILNVVGNAIKFTKEGSVTITVSSKKAEDLEDDPSSPGQQKTEKHYLHVEVKDTGIGIKASDIHRLFKKFVQADSSTTRNFGGTGLGLAISQKFVELMGGKITLESEGIGKGTTCKFFIVLLVIPEDECTLTTPGPRPAVGPGSPEDFREQALATEAGLREAQPPEAASGAEIKAQPVAESGPMPGVEAKLEAQAQPVVRLEEEYRIEPRTEAVGKSIKFEVELVEKGVQTVVEKGVQTVAEPSGGVQEEIRAQPSGKTVAESKAEIGTGLDAESKVEPVAKSRRETGEEHKARLTTTDTMQETKAGSIAEIKEEHRTQPVAKSVADFKAETGAGLNETKTEPGLQPVMRLEGEPTAGVASTAESRTEPAAVSAVSSAEVVVETKPEVKSSAESSTSRRIMQAGELKSLKVRERKPFLQDLISKVILNIIDLQTKFS